MRPVAAILLLVVFGSAPALAAPEDVPGTDRDLDSIVRQRAEMRAEYEARAEERRQALVKAAEETTGGSDAILGWKDSSTGRLPTHRVAAAPAAAPEDPPAPAPPKSDFPLLVVGAGVLLVLVLKVFLPWVFEIGMAGVIRRRKEEMEKAKGGISVTLRPRQQRLRDANRGR